MLPWLRIIDGVIGLTDVVRRVKGPVPLSDQEQLAVGGPRAGRIEARLAGVVVAALREAFDRDISGSNWSGSKLRRRGSGRSGRFGSSSPGRRLNEKSVGSDCSPPLRQRAGWSASFLRSDRCEASCRRRSFSGSAGYFFLAASRPRLPRRAGWGARSESGADDQASLGVRSAAVMMAPWLIIRGPRRDGRSRVARVTEPAHPHVPHAAHRLERGRILRYAGRRLT